MVAQSGVAGSGQLVVCQIELQSPATHLALNTCCVSSSKVEVKKEWVVCLVVFVVAYLNPELMVT